MTAELWPANFEEERVPVNGIELNVRTGGSGPPLYLLHGFPQTHVAWHRVAPTLAADFTVVMPDLRGYGASEAPPGDDAHTAYSKREMARDVVALADHFGHGRFALAGHDRGARVGYRLVLDHPGRVTRFCSIDVVPTLDVWEAMDADDALAQYHWPFLAIPAPVPEHLIGQDPEFYFRHLFERWAGDIDRLDPNAVAACLAQYRDPARIHAQCEDYRAGATIDRELDAADRAAGRRLDCPVLVLWARGYEGGKANSAVDTWKRWADEVEDAGLDCGHFVQEEQPDAAAAAMRGFFNR